MPPPTASLPGGYDFAQRAWFDRIGAVGTVLGDISRTSASGPTMPPLRTRLSAHIHDQIEGSSGGIAAALVTGDRGAISEADEEAMRRSGLAHLLSISGLHVTAVVGFAMFLTLRLFALSRRLALAGYVLPLAAAAGALAGGGYTLLAGAEVPTLRSFIAALLVLVAFLMGREALTLRLVAAGALIVLVWRPESLAGPSFQLSFAAITAIIALHESRPMRAFLARRDEPWPFRTLRAVAGLLVTGLVVEVALAPIALFHFHKAGVYGAMANVVAIPLTTFVIMPFEALALLFDSIGLGAPFWWVTEQALRLLLGLAHVVSDAPAAVATLPSFPPGVSHSRSLAGCGFCSGKRAGAGQASFRSRSARQHCFFSRAPICSSPATAAILPRRCPMAVMRCCATGRATIFATRWQKPQGPICRSRAWPTSIMSNAIAISAAGARGRGPRVMSFSPRAGATGSRVQIWPTPAPRPISLSVTAGYRASAPGAG